MPVFLPHSATRTFVSTDRDFSECIVSGEGFFQFCPLHGFQDETGIFAGAMNRTPVRSRTAFSAGIQSLDLNLHYLLLAETRTHFFKSGSPLIDV
jgi:hypothetical protein